MKGGDFVTGKLFGKTDARQGWISEVRPDGTFIITGESGTDYLCEGAATLVRNPPEARR